MLINIGRKKARKKERIKERKKKRKKKENRKWDKEKVLLIHTCMLSKQVRETLQESMYLYVCMHASVFECVCILNVFVTCNIACENILCIQIHSFWWKRSDWTNGKSLLMSGQRCIYITFMWHVAYIYYCKWGQETENTPFAIVASSSCQLPGCFRPHRGSPFSHSHLSDRCITAGQQWHKWVVQPANQQRVIGQWKKQ